MYLPLRKNLNEETFTEKNTEVQTDVWMEETDLNLNFEVRVKLYLVIDTLSINNNSIQHKYKSNLEVIDCKG